MKKPVIFTIVVLSAFLFAYFYPTDTNFQNKRNSKQNTSERNASTPSRKDSSEVGQTANTSSKIPNSKVHEVFEKGSREGDVYRELRESGEIKEINEQEVADNMSNYLTVVAEPQVTDESERVVKFPEATDPYKTIREK